MSDYLPGRFLRWRGFSVGWAPTQTYPGVVVHGVGAAGFARPDAAEPERAAQGGQLMPYSERTGVLSCTGKTWGKLCSRGERKRPWEPDYDDLTRLREDLERSLRDQIREAYGRLGLPVPMLGVS